MNPFAWIPIAIVALLLIWGISGRLSLVCVAIALGSVIVGAFLLMGAGSLLASGTAIGVIFGIVMVIGIVWFLLSD